ncbi:ATP-binding protein [Pararhizobium gei]|uniref:ATP-binding protein n=1 Tax=Pararhizobium gei TaxID=1395951 RepID=UPI0023DB9252|nr:AAA family ATPase [Rhizobium gei]
MRLSRLDLVRYGKFTGRSLDFGALHPGRPDFHLVYGPNEAGKSTLFSGFLDLLFGIERLSSYGFLHPYPTMRIGGIVETGGRAHEVFRVKKTQNSLLGSDEQPLPDNLFSAALGSIDRATYRMMFSLDDESIEKGGESILKSEGELGTLLFSASSGLPDSSSVLAGLKTQADAFYKPQGRKHRLSELKSALEALKDEKTALDVNAREFAALRKARDAAAERHEAAIRTRAELRVSLDLVRDRMDGLPLLARLRGLRSELASLGDLPEPPADWHALLPQLQREETEIGVRIAQLQADVERRTAEIAAIGRDPAGLALASAIDELENSELEARYRTAAKDMPARLDEREKIVADIVLRLGRLDRTETREPEALILPAAVSGRILDLAQKQSALEERLGAAAQEHKLAAQACADALRGQAALPGDGGATDGAGLARLVQSLRQNDCLMRQQTASRQISALEHALGEKLAVLASGHSDADALAALPVPDEMEMAEFAARRTALGEQLKRLDERIAEDAAQLAAEEARLDSLKRRVGFAGDDAALSLRAERDRAWQAHMARLDRDSATGFADALRRDDEATVLRLAQSQEVAEARALSLSIAERQGKLSVLRHQQAAVFSQVDELRADISAVALAAGLTADTKLNQLTAWLARRSAVLDLRGQLRAAQQDLAQAQLDEGKALTRLRRSLAEAGFEKTMPERLDDALVFAEGLIDKLQSQVRDRAASAAAVEQAEVALRMREAAVEAARTAMADWQEAWQETVAPTWLARNGAALLPQEVRPVLAVLQDLEMLLQRKADLDHRIEGMRKDQIAFTRSVHALAIESSHPLSDRPLGDFDAIRARFVEAERRESLFVRLSAENRERNTELETLREDQRRHEVQKSAILDLFGCMNLSAAAECLERVKVRLRLRERISEAEGDLAQRLGVGNAGDAELMLASVDADGLKLEGAELQAKWEQCDIETSELHAMRRDAEKTLSAIGGSDAAAHVEERRRTVLAEIEEGAIAYLRLRTGILAGETALRLYRERHRSAMMRRASAAFSAISGGDYEGLATQAENGREFLIAKAAGGGSKLADDLSKGTRFQLYLALRIAGYHEVATTRESLPFIADDIMETFDDGRAEHAFRLMAGMAGAGQVIYLTHHEHLCEIARKACPQVSIHTL